MASDRRLADAVDEIARQIAVTSAWVALAWLLSRDLPVAAIPGERRINRLEENWASQDTGLRSEHLQRLDSLIHSGVAGERCGLLAVSPRVRQRLTRAHASGGSSRRTRRPPKCLNPVY